MQGQSCQYEDRKVFVGLKIRLENSVDVVAPDVDIVGDVLVGRPAYYGGGGERLVLGRSHRLLFA